MIKPAVLDAMVAAGCTAEQIAAAVKADQAQSTNAERQARFRARRKALLVTDSNVTPVTSRNAPAPLTPPLKSPPYPQKITPPISPQPPLSVHSHLERDFFAEFWLAYPRREGANPKKPARQSFQRLLAKGTDPERIIEAAQALARQHPSPTPFIPMPATWLNQERFGDELPVITGDEFCPEEWPNTRFLKIRFRDERGHDPPSAVQGGKAGVLLPAEWVTASRLATTNGKSAAH